MGQKPHPPVVLGGESDHTLARVVEFCDGWLPRARGGFDPAEGMGRLRRAAEAAALEAYAEAGVSRALLMLPPADRDTVLGLLDDYAPLLG